MLTLSHKKLKIGLKIIFNYYQIIMLLSDYTIKRYLQENVIKLDLPSDETLDDILKNVTCASFDLRLGNHLKIFPKNCEDVLNPFREQSNICMEELNLSDDEEFVMQP